MSRSQAKLRIVEPSPEGQLRALFAREDELLADLATVRAEQREARNDYAKAHGLLIRPGMATLRKVLLP